MKIRNCTECRKKIRQEEQERYLKSQYSWINDGMYTMACLATSVALSVQMQRGRSKEYIQKLFSDMVMLYTTSSVMGKKLVLTDVMKQLEKEYDIDFGRIHVNLDESEREFIKNCKEGMKRWTTE